MSSVLTAAVVPAMLCVVAAGQMACASLGHLSPWKGGGFGMFASLDRPDNRFLVVSAIGVDANKYRITIATDIVGSEYLTASYLNKTKTYPTHARLVSIAEAVRTSRAYVKNVTPPPSERLRTSPYFKVLTSSASRDAELAIKPAAGGMPIGSALTSITVSVLRVRYEPASSRVSIEAVADATVSGGRRDE
jgi:hypothetical protein